MTSLEEHPEWIDDLDPSIFEDSDPEPQPDAGEVAVREWINRKLRRIAVLRRERAVQKQIAGNERARIDMWENETIGTLDRAIAYQSVAVEGWMRDRIEQDPKTRSYVLPAGRVQARALDDKIDIDPDLIPALLEAYPQFGRTTVSLDKKALNAAVKGGSGFDGVVVETGRVSITIMTEDAP